MAYIPMTTFEDSTPDVQAEYNDQIAKQYPVVAPD